MKPTSKFSSILCLDFHCSVGVPPEVLTPEITKGFYLFSCLKHKEAFHICIFVHHAWYVSPGTAHWFTIKMSLLQFGIISFQTYFQKNIYEIGKWACHYINAFVYYPCAGKISTLIVFPSHLPHVTFCLYRGIQTLWLVISRLIYDFNCIIISLPNLRQIIELLEP